MSGTIVIRRSLLRVPLLDAAAMRAAGLQNADVVIIEPGDILGRMAAEDARAALQRAVVSAAAGGAEVFVRLTPGYARAEVDVSASRSLAGYVLPVERDAEAVARLARHLDRVEERRGVGRGRLEVFPLISGAGATWRVREVVTASERVRSVALDEGALAADLGIVARPDFDPFSFARGRVVVESIAAGRQPIGLCHPLSVIERPLPADELARHATKARNSGFKGAFCRDPAWVAPLNAAFSPTAEQVAYYREVRKAFAEGIARGTAAVPFEGRMIDVPVDERARLMIRLWEECQRRDAEKAAAQARSSAGARA